MITAVVVEKRPAGEVAREYGVSRSWLYELLARYREEGEAAFEPRSRRPASSPTAIGEEAEALIIRLRKELDGGGLDAGPHTIAWHLESRHGLKVPASTVHRHLARAGLVAPQPRKRPRSSWIRFQAEQPNECWQSDFTHWALADGRDAEILAWVDDHSRLILSLTAHMPVTGLDVLETFRAACAAHGAPAATLTDNGLVFTTRLLRGSPANALEAELAARGVTRKNGKPNHPQTQGKVERLRQTLKRWLARQPPAETLAALQARLDAFADEYNHRRPHRAVNRMTPAAAYAARPKAAPARPAGAADSRTAKTAPNGTVSYRRDGRSHHIAIGRRHAGATMQVITRGLRIQIVDPATGELIRELTLDPTRNYQPTGAPPGRTPQPTPKM